MCSILEKQHGPKEYIIIISEQAILALGSAGCGLPVQNFKTVNDFYDSFQPGAVQAVAARVYKGRG